jgi:anti-sigma factor RsiW
MLHGFVDGRLDAEHRAQVEAWLASEPEAAARVRAWQAQREMLRLAFDSAPVPAAGVLLRALLQRRLRRGFWRGGPFATAAAVLFVLILGGGGGWLLRGTLAPSPTPLAVLEREARATYAVYATDRRHPIEVAATERDHLTQWLSNRLSRRVAPPDLASAGWHLLGGRLLATERGSAAALFMYANDQGNRLSVVMRPMSPDISLPVPQRVTGDINGCAWIVDGIGYAVLGAMSADESATVARLVQQQTHA